jgi:hypothetical protein
MTNLRERVARAICDTDWGEGHYDSDALSQLELTAYEIMASAVIAIVLEEAAKECMEELPEGDDEFTKGYRLACEENARNLRALKEKP